MRFKLCRIHENIKEEECMSVSGTVTDAFHSNSKNLSVENLKLDQNYNGLAYTGKAYNTKPCISKRVMLQDINLVKNALLSCITELELETMNYN
jgi:hypothetical protein